MATGEVNGRLWGAEAEDWAAVQEGTCRSVYEAVLERLGVGAGTRYLDVGCGAGMAASLADARGAQVWGLDAAEGLLEIARRRVPGGEFVTGELEALPYPDDSFDVVTGFNSFQYAADPGAALRQAARVAKRGGWVVVMTWGTPEGMEAVGVLRALTPLLPVPPKGTPGPLALSDEAVLRKFAEDAGLRPVEVMDVDSPWFYQDLQTALRGLGSSGVARKAIEFSGREAVDAAHRKVLEGFARGNGSYRVGAWFRCLLSRA